MVLLGPPEQPCEIMTLLADARVAVRQQHLREGQRSFACAEVEIFLLSSVHYCIVQYYTEGPYFAQSRHMQFDTPFKINEYTSKINNTVQCFGFLHISLTLTSIGLATRQQTLPPSIKKLNQNDKVARDCPSCRCLASFSIIMIQKPNDRSASVSVSHMRIALNMLFSMHHFCQASSQLELLH